MPCLIHSWFLLRVARDLQVSRTAAFSLMRLPLFEVRCLPWTGSVATKEKRGRCCVELQRALLCPFFREWHSLKWKQAIHTYHLSYLKKRKTEKARGQISFSLGKLQSSIIVFVTSCHKDGAGETKLLFKPSCCLPCSPQSKREWAFPWGLHLGGTQFYHYVWGKWHINRFLKGEYKNSSRIYGLGISVLHHNLYF